MKNSNNEFSFFTEFFFVVFHIRDDHKILKLCFIYSTTDFVAMCFRFCCSLCDRDFYSLQPKKKNVRLLNGAFVFAFLVIPIWDFRLSDVHTCILFYIHFWFLLLFIISFFFTFSTVCFNLCCIYVFIACF